MNTKKHTTEITTSERNYKKEFMSLIHGHAGAYSPAELFIDFLDMAALMTELAVIKEYTKIANISFEEASKETYEEMEEIKMQHSRDGYNMIKLTISLLDILAKKLDERSHDFLGDIYMELNLKSNKFGQFFTPPTISNLIAKNLFTKEIYEKSVSEKGFLSVSEPSCGSGGLIIEAFNTLREEVGDKIYRTFFVHATDISNACAQMTFIQFSMLGIPAVVTKGDILRLTRSRTNRLTLGYYKNGCGLKTGMFKYIPVECFPLFVKSYKDDIEKRNALQNLAIPEEVTPIETEQSNTSAAI